MKNAALFSLFLAGSALAMPPAQPRTFARQADGQDHPDGYIFDKHWRMDCSRKQLDDKPFADRMQCIIDGMGGPQEASCQEEALQKVKACNPQQSTKQCLQGPWFEMIACHNRIVTGRVEKEKEKETTNGGTVSQPEKETSNDGATVDQNEKETSNGATVDQTEKETTGNATESSMESKVCREAAVKVFEKCRGTRERDEPEDHLDERCGKERDDAEKGCLDVEVQNGAVVDGKDARKKKAECAVTGNRAFSKCMKDMVLNKSGETRKDCEQKRKNASEACIKGEKPESASPPKSESTDSAAQPNTSAQSCQ